MKTRVNFTIALLTTARPKSKSERLVLNDSKTPGLQCRISHTGVVAFSVYRRLKSGRIERVTIGRFPDMSIEMARKQATKILASIADGKNPGEVKRAHKAELTFKELYEEYLNGYAMVQKRSWRCDEAFYRLYMERPLGSKKLSQITREDVEALHYSISRQVNKLNKKEKTYKTTTANRVVVTISGIFSWGMKKRFCKVNPAQGVEKNPERSRDRFLMPEELSKFFSAVEKEKNKTIRDYVLLSLFTGARRGNMVSMRWADISFQEKIWCIPDTKNKEPHVVPLIDEAISILKDRLAEQKNKKSDFVFPGNGKDGYMVEPRFGWKRILKEAGISNLRIHDLRRTLGSWQAIKGSSTLVIGKSLGHKTIQATAIYARLNLDPVRKSIELATKGMLNAGKKEKARMSIRAKFNAVNKPSFVGFIMPKQVLL